MGFKAELAVTDPVEACYEVCPSLGFWEGTDFEGVSGVAGSDECIHLCYSHHLSFWMHLNQFIGASMYVCSPSIVCTYLQQM